MLGFNANADTKQSALSPVTTINDADTVTGLQSGVNKNFPALALKTYINPGSNPTYLLCCFANSDDSHLYMFSTNDPFPTNMHSFTGHPMLINYSTNSSRDPTLLQDHNQLLIAYTTCGFGTGTTFDIASTRDYVHGVVIAHVDCSGVSGCNQVWVGKWIPASEASDAIPHLTIAISTDSGTTHRLYHIEPTNYSTAADPAAWTWSTPTAITGTGITGVGIYNQISIKKLGPNYVGILSNNNTHRIEYSESTSMFTGQNVYAPSNGADYFGLGQNEGASILQIPGTNLVYLYGDNIGNMNFWTLHPNNNSLIGYTGISSNTAFQSDYPPNQSQMNGMRNGSLLALSGNWNTGTGLISDQVAPTTANFLYNAAMTNLPNTFTLSQTFSGGMTGNGSGLTSLTAASITGSHTLPDGVHSTNVPLLNNASNQFSGATGLGVNGGLAVGPGVIPSAGNGYGSGLMIGGNAGWHNNNFVLIAANATGTFAGDNGVGQVVISDVTSGNYRLGFLLDSTNHVSKIQSQLSGSGGIPLELNPAGGNVVIGTSTDDGSTPVQLGGNAKVSGNLITTGTVTQSVSSGVLHAVSGVLTAEPSGTFTLVSGAKTVSDTNVTANSTITVLVKTVSGTRAGNPDIVPTPGTGFTASGAATDNSTYNYWIGN